MTSLSQKLLWEELAEKDAIYYIDTKLGRDADEKKFRESGEADYKKLVADDPLVRGRGVIMDFGCGTGRLTEFMEKDFVGVIGVDISKEMLRQAEERLGNKVILIETDGYKIDFSSFFVDVVLANLVFPHMKEREMVESNFAEIRRALVPGGIFKVYMKNDRGLERDNKLSKWWNGITYTLEDAYDLANRHNFEVLQHKYINKRKTNYWLWLKAV